MLKKNKSNLPKGEFVKNVLTLITGTTISQAIPIAISPILTRIYTPEDFGLITVFIAIVTLIAVLVNGRYELAILLPEKDEDAINIFAIGFIINVSISFILLILIIFFHNYLLILLNNKDLSLWLYFIPLVVFLLGFYNLLNYFNNRKKKYRDIAVSKIVKAIALSIIQLSIGFLKKGAFGLFSGQIASNFVANATLIKNVINDKVLLSTISKEKILTVGRRYVDFPKFLMWSALLNSASLQIPIVLLSSFFMPSIVGFFALSHRFISMPMALIGSSIGEVFFQKSAEIKNDKEALKTLTFSTYKKLLKIGIIPFSIFTFFGDYIFLFFFGEKWLIAGQYAQTLSIWILFVFITSPISNLFSTLELQKKSLTFNVLIFISRILVLLIGGLIIRDPYLTILIYGITGTVFWVLFGFYLLKIVGVKYKESFLFTFKIIFTFLPVFGALRLLIKYILI